MKQKKFLRTILLSALFLLTVCLLCGCGATVDTDMTIEDGFVGTRTISLTIAAEDLTEYVTGGIGGLETVITQNIPEGMTYDIGSTESGDSVINFHIAFSSQEDYTTKVTTILTAGGITQAPEITYDKKDNPFKKGIVFSENFDSIELMEWYKIALKTSGIISESSTSNWYERGGSKITVAGQEFTDSYGYEFDIDKMVYNMPNDVEIETTVAMDGSIVRVVDFTVEETVYEQLKADGCNLDTYFNALISDSDAVLHVQDENYSYYRHFIVTLNAATASELVEKTNKLLNTETNTFGWTVVTKEDAPGYATITVKENLDTSYYVGSYSTRSSVKIFENAQLNDDETVYFSDSGFYYSPYGEEVEAVLTWKIGFEKVELALKPYGKENLNATMTFTVNSAFDETIRSSAFASVENYAEKFKVEKEDNLLTVSVKGSAKEVSNALNELAKGSSAMDYDFVTVEVLEASTLSPFTSGKKVVVEYDFSELLGDNAQIVLSDGDNLYLSEVNQNEDGTVWVDSEGEIALYKKSVKVFPILLMILFILLICGAVVLAVFAKNEILATIAFFKNLKIQKPTKQPAAVAAAPAVTPDVTEATTEESEDEEVLL